MELSFVTIDLETTGLEEDSEIIEIGMVKYQGGKEVAVFNQLIKPQRPIPEQITKLTGITNGMVSNKPSWSQVEKQVLEFLGQDMLIAHNASFDRGFLERAIDGTLSNRWLDTFELAKVFLPCLSSYKLATLGQYFGLGHTTFHRALSDAQITGQVYVKLVQLIKDTPLETLGEIITILEEEGQQPLVIFLREISKGLVAGYTFDQRLHQPQEEPALEASPDPEVFNLDMGVKILEPEGLMSRCSSTYQYRPQQVAMLKTIIESFTHSKHGILEGGTGIGKSFAYLIPALLWSFERKKRVVVATNTIALQEQLFNKDIPFLERCFGHKLSVTLTKGRNNYLCLRRYNRFKEPNQKNNWQIKLFLAQVYVWLEKTWTGDKEELNLNNFESEYWSQVSSQSETCLGGRCSYFQNSCYFFKNRRQCENSDLIITNHALLLQDVKSENKILPKYEYCIIDEAHNLEDEATEQFSQSVDLLGLIKLCGQLFRGNNVGLLDRLLTNIKKKVHIYTETQDIIDLSEGLKEPIASLRSSLEQALEELYRDSPILYGELRLTEKERGSSWWQESQQKLKIVLENLTNINLKLFHIINRLELEDQLEESLKEITFYKGKILKAKEELASFLEWKDQEMVYWLNIANPYKYRNVGLVSTPLLINKLLNEWLFQMKKSVILTSATLTIANNFKYTAEQYGLQDNYLTFNGQSPFNYQDQSVVLIPNDLGDPSTVSDEVFAQRVVATLGQMIPNIAGGILLLFTSYTLLNGVYYGLKEEEGLNERLILAHGKDGNRNYLIEAMHKNPNTIVLGTNSFWEGVDISGDNLATVVIVKLPFVPPTRPITAARLEMLKNSGQNSFMKYSLPQAILRFRQGYGRLIRTAQDKGAVIILDNRVITKRYGREFLKSLPSQRTIVATTPEICGWLSKWLDDSSQTG